jgi:large subunit ribosomal protein L29
MAATKKAAAAKAAKQDLSVLGAPELRKELHLALDKRAKLEFQHNVAPLKNPLELRHLRRDIARLQTYLRSKKEAAK